MVLLPHGAFLTEDRLTFTPGTAEPLGVSPPEAVDSLLIESKREKLSELCRNWFEYGEYLTVEIDTDAQSIAVVPR